MAEFANLTAPTVAAIAKPLVPPTPTGPFDPEPATTPLPVEKPEPVVQSEPTLLAQPDLAAQNESVGPPTPLPPTEASNPSSQTRVRGDSSSPQRGETDSLRQAPVGVRARPNYRNNAQPPYPLAARRRRQEGVVLLSVKVSAHGQAVHVELKQSSGFPVLDEAAIQAIRGWEFEPARINSTSVDSQIEVPVRFKLQP